MRISRFFCAGFSLLFGGWCAAADSQMTDTPSLRMPAPGSYQLRILATNLLELTLINSKPPDPARVDSWDFVDAGGVFHAPALSEFAVTVGGQPAVVQSVGFKRRPLYAPLAVRDLRIDNRLYLRLATAVGNNQTVEVKNPGGTLWPASKQFIAIAAPLRFNPAIHVNQQGYVPSLPKKAIVGYYLGSLGEMDIPAAAGFRLVDANSNAEVYQGTLVARPDVGYTNTLPPYQKVFEADFTSFATPGDYRLLVPGLGTSLPFAINDGVAMAFVRTYALGLYHQRCGTSNALPFTRFTHDVCHGAPASVPSPQSSFGFTWYVMSAYARSVNPDNPPQIAPALTNEAAQLYPFVNRNSVDVSGGHHDAGDYSKYTINSAALIHHLVFAADSFPGVGALDNLGLPESGDGKSDVLQEAKWEADFLAKMQDADGGFYFLVYPREREYESNVLPEQGDPQVVWPKTTASTAVGVAALAQCASSPRFKQQFPAAASLYLQKAQLGWAFLTNAIALHGKAGAYQKLTPYGDEFTHNDELAWAACEMYLATTNSSYHQKLLEWFPNPNDPATWRWGWRHMYASYGNAIRSYAFAVRSGRLAASQLDSTYRVRCETEIAAAANDLLTWALQNAYGTSFPQRDKDSLNASWYFSSDRAFDLTVAYQLDPRSEFLDAILGNLDYEGGCNPVNVCYLTGLGWKRQREVVHQYAQNDRRALPPSGIPLGNIQSGFQFLPNYGSELGALNFPPDGAAAAPYPLYDRWGDSYNIATEFVSLQQARSLGSLAFLAAQTSLASQTWRAASAQITGLPVSVMTNATVTAALNVPGMDLTSARVVWEARDQEPAFGTSFTFTPTNYGPHRIEAEAAWPDGRRAFASASFFVTDTLPTVTVVATVPNASEEGPTPGQFTVSRDSGTNDDLTVNYQFSGTAAKFDDYRRPQGDMPEFVVIPAGSLSATITIVPVNDTIFEGVETATLTIAGNTAYHVGAPAAATITIADNELGILRVIMSAGGDATLTWVSVPGKHYQVICKDNLDDPGWTVLNADIAATGPTTSWTDAALPSRTQRFYSVRTVP